MQTIDETLSLLQRQVEFDTTMRQPGNIRITEEQQLHHLRQQLTQFPEAVQARDAGVARSTQAGD